MITNKRANTVVLYAVALLGAMSEPAFAEGVTATWRPTAAGTYSWNDAANWDADRIPTNSADVVHLDIDTEGAQTIQLVGATSLGTVIGRADQTISSPPRTTFGRTFRNIHVANPNGFAGQWTSGDSGALWFPSPTEDFTPLFASFESKMRPAMSANSGWVRFGTLTGGGMLYIYGHLNAQVDDVALDTRGRTRLHIPDGSTLSLAMASRFPSNAVAGHAEGACGTWIRGRRGVVPAPHGDGVDGGHRRLDAYNRKGGRCRCAGTRFRQHPAARRPLRRHINHSALKS